MIDNMLQGNRLHKLLSRRICEFVALLRKAVNATLIDMINKFLGKKHILLESNTGIEEVFKQSPDTPVLK